MKFGEKLQILRKKYSYSQEELAEKCQVSRQAISKWEANKTIPEVDKLLIISDIFKISLDVLLKEEMNIDATIENHTCHKIKKENQNGYFEGLLIKESILDEGILDALSINKVELWQTKDKPKYWTALYFTSKDLDLPTKFAKVMLSKEEQGESWYVDFKNKNTKYIVLKNKILKYELGNMQEKNKVKKECLKLGIDISGIEE